MWNTNVSLYIQESPDWNPILGQHPHHPNIIFGLGFSGMGMGLTHEQFVILHVSLLPDDRSWVQVEVESSDWEDTV